MPQTNLNLGKLLPAPSLKEMALATIKEAMFSKKLEQEVMYTEAGLTNELGISRTPVREALIHLASRGLITYFPRKGFKIKLLTETGCGEPLRVAARPRACRHPPHRAHPDEGLAERDRTHPGAVPEDRPQRGAPRIDPGQHDLPRLPRGDDGEHLPHQRPGRDPGPHQPGGPPEPRGRLPTHRGDRGARADHGRAETAVPERGAPGDGVPHPDHRGAGAGEDSLHEERHTEREGKTRREEWQP